MRMRSDQTGFTLIELLVVLAIVGILAGVGLSFSLGRPSTAVRGVTNDVFGVLQAAKNLARNSGRNVVLQTSGTEPGKSLRLDYGFFAQNPDGTDNFSSLLGSTPTNPVMGTLAIDPALSRYAQVGDATSGQATAAATNPAPASDLVLKNLEPAAFWAASSSNLFSGSNSPAAPAVFYFKPDGTPSQDFYVPVVGVRSGTVAPDAPVGLMLASRASGLLAFLKPNSSDSTKPWRRL